MTGCPSSVSRRSVARVTTIVRATRVLVILMLAVLTISLVMALGTANTGWIEKIVLVLLIGGCVYAAAKVTTLSERFVHRLARH
jgi:uncharacterized membrane protein YbhN (UPF0104 family)